MALPDIPAAKRAGLPVDLHRLTADGDDWLSPEERYALKTHGVCAQTQAGVFMIRVRTSGSLTAAGARALAGIAEQHAAGWIHLTTRQQVELHHVPARAVTAVLGSITDAGLTTRSACGHTVRGVMSCPDAGVGLDEPFDCGPDARAVEAALLARTPMLDTQLPSRFNISFGGCATCREHARLNEAGLVSVIRDGEPGYEMWVGGSLGKAVPTLAIKALDFVPRRHVVAAVEALLDVFVERGNFDQPNKARMKFLIRALGEEQFLDLFRDAYIAACLRSPYVPAPIALPDQADVAAVLGQVPLGGWSSGVRPQRQAGLALVTATVPIGDMDATDLRLLADLCERHADGSLHLTRNQNVTFRNVPVEEVGELLAGLAEAGLGLEGADQANDVRACTGGPVCVLAITPAQAAAQRLLESPALRRNSDLRVHVSGCPNACAQHQIADLGFSGGKVSIGDVSVLGYQVWLGGDLANGIVGEIVGRVADADVVAVAEALVGVWEATRHHGETVAATADRIGLDALRAHVAAVLGSRWEAGPEPPVLLRPVERALPLAVA
jgi:sulfite reductase beta subunit-like hemoprotein